MSQSGGSLDQELSQPRVSNWVSPDLGPLSPSVGLIILLCSGGQWVERERERAICVGDG